MPSVFCTDPIDECADEHERSAVVGEERQDSSIRAVDGRTSDVEQHQWDAAAAAMYLVVDADAIDRRVALFDA
jgi:hypothetical protein